MKQTDKIKPAGAKPAKKSEKGAGAKSKAPDAAGQPRHGYIPIDDLVPYATNARTHSEDQITQIAASIAEFGFTNPILVWRGTIVGGHGRWAAAKKLLATGLDKHKHLISLPVIHLDYLSDAQRRAYILADNRLALNAGWDNEMLSLEMKALNDMGLELGITGFDEDEISALLGNEPEEPKDSEALGTMSFALTEEQKETVKEALDISMSLGNFDGPNENERGNALARICEMFINQQGKQPLK